MELKSFKTIHILYAIVSVSALLTACHTKVTEPMKLMSKIDAQEVVENYGVPQAQSVVFGIKSDEYLSDLTY
jgi:hypothetical protein